MTIPKYITLFDVTVSEISALAEDTRKILKNFKG